MAGGIAKRLGALAVATALSLALSLPTSARTILRDAELERSLRELARPIIAAAGLSPAQIDILVMEDSSLNAFVLDSGTIFIHSGLLLKMERPEMLQGVIAHEVAHIANGHLARRPINAQNARTAAMAGLALSALVASQSPAAAAGLAIGSQSSAQRVFLSHTRAEEASADQSALRYMARAGVPPQGMVDALEIFSGQEALSAARQDPYVLSHPLSRDRLRAARGHAAAQGKGIEGTDAASAYWYARAHAKLSAYMRNPSWTLRRIGKGDSSDPALIARAVANNQARQFQPALAAAEQLIAKRPEDAYARELKAWILMEARQFDASAATYAQAVNLAPNEPLILAAYGSALLAQDTAASNTKALEILERSRARDTLNPSVLRDLGLAYSRAGQPGMASVVTAERYALAGRLQDAEVHAKRASGLLPRGSTGWRRAQDIVLAAETQSKRKTRQ
ncbi:M48 family metalloprotease [Tropicimonas sediminicola]|uniref:Putative Zn-dependent protease, contains TPR repeats n=1 Tax=Tropicimonas sediminicola TaxID=1031541 RepID=A0A239GQ21_9RHOB|nr:M48 family metalloprotease [Tropicimonas sediminicola]SNS70603.1 Putative Zn-dependent protease, contains TPR repeats [Tropicimonas sediminicola]